MPFIKSFEILLRGWEEDFILSSNQENISSYWLVLLFLTSITILIKNVKISREFKMSEVLNF
jgi:hypothetical protein